MPLGPRVQELWNLYLSSLPVAARAQDAWVEAAPAGNPALTDGLLGLYLAGKKSAGSSLLADFRASGEPLPRVGDYWIVLDSGGAPRLILRTARVEQHRFADIPREVARAEGEGDSSVGDWKRLHAQFFAPYLAGWGVEDLASATVVTEFLEEVFRTDATGFLPSCRAELVGFEARPQQP